ncbi:MAG: hypothetical protein WCS31_03790 [Verrucomicrobiae bacterium]
MINKTNIKRIYIADPALTPSAAISELNIFHQREWPVAVPPQKSREGDVVLALISDKLMRPLIDDGLTNLHNKLVSSDAFHVLSVNGTVYILGSSGRGILQGVYQFILHSESNKNELRGTFSFPYRIFALLMDGVFKPDFPTETIRSCVKYLSVMGASHVAATNDFSGDPQKSFYSYVESSIFPNSSTSESRQKNRRVLRDIIDAAKEFGMDILFESIFMPSSRDRESLLALFPEEVISYVGEYQGWGLCMGHPDVQAFYREITERFFQDFPEISVLHYITLDAGGDLCVQETCPRCRGLSKFDQRDRISKFIAGVAGKVRPGLKLFNTAFEWDRNNFGMGEMLVRQATMPENIGLCMSATSDSATYDQQLHHHLIEARNVTWRAGQTFLGRDAFHFFDDSRIKDDDRTIVDYPLGVIEKVQRWNDLKADGIYDVRGRIVPDYLFINSLFFREAAMNPQLDSSLLALTITGEFFGAAQDAVIAAWEKIQQAHRLLSNGYTFPSASKPTQYFPWFLGRNAPLPSEPEFSSVRIPDNELPPCMANGFIYHNGSYPERLMHTGKTMLQAATHLNGAINELEKAFKCEFGSQTPVRARLLMGDSFTWNAQEYLNRSRGYLMFIRCCNAFAGAYFTLRGLYLASDQDDASLCADGGALLKIYACNVMDFADCLDELEKALLITLPRAPHLTRELLLAKAEAVRQYLTQVFPVGVLGGCGEMSVDSA